LWNPELGLGAGGDWAVGGRVEGAFTAGRLLAEAVVATR
jgi:predicted NAD/FAD-dependent oxidoreductase